MKPDMKKKIYLTLWLVLGALLGTFVGEIIELVFTYENSEALEHKLVIYGVLVLIGLIFGIWAGPIAWRKIYVEGVRGKKYLVKGDK